VDDLIRRQQGRRNSSPSSGFASFRQVVEYVSVLLAQSDDNGQNTFNKSAAVFTLGAPDMISPTNTEVYATSSSEAITQELMFSKLVLISL